MLTFESLADWQRWQQRQASPFKQLVARSHRQTDALCLYGSGAEPGQPAVVVAIDAATASHVRALFRPAEALRHRGVAVVVVAPRRLAGELAGIGYDPIDHVDDAGSIWEGSPHPVLAVIAAGHYMPAGGAAFRLATESGAPYLVVQHGVLTPLSPPLPPGAHLLAWTDADARFWCSGRKDVMSTVVGSQMLWEAGRRLASGVSNDVGSVVFLGQLHGAELPRNVTVATVSELGRDRTFLYRPHPSENDVRSRARHWVWRHQGIRFTDPDIPLPRLGAPVAAIFSTGILEAAASGMPAYAWCARPPRWVSELWDRYGMGRLDRDEPTRVVLPELEPAEVIADAVGVFA